MENKSSTMLPVKSGVPQGSILGPILFLVYINDLPDCIQNSKCFLFADDTKLLKSFRDTRDEILMQDDLNALSLWCEKWNIGLNVSKCKTIRLSLKQTEETSHYSVQDNTIEQVNSYRDLGITVTQDLSWSLWYPYDMELTLR